MTEGIATLSNELFIPEITSSCDDSLSTRFVSQEGASHYVAYSVNVLC